MSINRRGILGLLGAGAAAPAVGKAAEMLGAQKAALDVAVNQIPWPMPAVGSMAGAFFPQNDPVKQAAFNLLQNQLEAEGDRQRVREILRQNGLDADISSLRLPRATLVRMQATRERESRSFMRDMAARLNQFWRES